MSGLASSGLVALIGGDLNALSRVEAACRAAGRGLLQARDLQVALDGPGPALVLVDLDEGGYDAVNEVIEARRSGRLTAPVVAFFSHVDVELGHAAGAAGIRALPRGRFWRELPSLVAEV